MKSPLLDINPFRCKFCPLKIYDWNYEKHVAATWIAYFQFFWEFCQVYSMGTQFKNSLQKCQIWEYQRFLVYIHFKSTYPVTVKICMMQTIVINNERSEPVPKWRQADICEFSVFRYSLSVENPVFCFNLCFTGTLYTYYSNLQQTSNQKCPYMYIRTLAFDALC